MNSLWYCSFCTPAPPNSSTYSDSGNFLVSELQTCSSLEVRFVSHSLRSIYREITMRKLCLPWNLKNSAINWKFYKHSLTHMNFLQPHMYPISSLPTDLMPLTVHSESFPWTDLDKSVHVFIGSHRLLDLSQGLAWKLDLSPFSLLRSCSQFLDCLFWFYLMLLFF
jgi:hypothetical protein